MVTRNVSHTRNFRFAAMVIVVAGCTGFQPAPAPAKGGSIVKVVGKPGSYQLIRNGKPYFINGVGGSGNRQLLLKVGANSFRTWGPEGAQEVLDAAHRDGLTVTLGVWLEHSPAFDYSNAELVKKQFEMCKSVVQKYKDHPALLMYSFGNEMEGNAEDPAVWRAIEDIAAMSKKLDPNHPVMTVTAEIGGPKVPNLNKYCKSVDIHGINSYGGAPSLKKRYAEMGGTKPYILTEFGPPGAWEVGKTRWDAPIEMTSTQKAQAYETAYTSAVIGNPGQCLGSYAFLWGNKQEATATWFGMLLSDGSPTQAVDVMSKFWTGKARPNLVPRIDSLTVSQTDMLAPGQVITASLTASDPEKRPVNVKWVLVGEGKERLTAGRDEAVPDGFPEALMSGSTTTAQFRMPKVGGGYRVFAYVFDEVGGAAVANVPVFVAGSN